MLVLIMLLSACQSTPDKPVVISGNDDQLN